MRTFLPYMLSAALCLLCSAAFAQKKTLQVSDATNPALRVKGLESAQWMPDKDVLVYFDRDKKAYMQVNPAKKDAAAVSFLPQDSFNLWMRNSRLDTFSSLPALQFKSADQWVFGQNNTTMLYNPQTRSISRKAWWPKDAENTDVSASGHVAYTSGGNLFIVKAPDTSSWQIAQDGAFQVVYGEAAHRSEFGIVKGTFWSTDGNKLAFYRIDQSHVKDYPLIDYREIPAKATPIKYPMAGDSSQQVTVGIADPATQKVVYLQTGLPADQYLTNITWSPDSKFVYIAVLNRDQNKMNLRRYNASTGALDKELFEETNPKYVEPEHGPIFFPNDPSRFLWYSERSGSNHLYVYNTDGQLQQTLTGGDWNVEDVLGFSKDQSLLYLSTTKDGPLGRQAYSVNLKTGVMLPLSRGAGSHNVKVSPSGKYIYDSYTGINDPGASRILEAKTGNVVKTLLQHVNPLADYNCGEVSVFSMKAADGVTDLYARLIKPAGFDPSKKYPVLYYVYGGPHAQMVRDNWLGGADMFLNYMASQGYVVFTMDNRGSGGRNLAFEQATFRQLGEVELADQMQGVNWLKSQGYVDSTRMACFGWSYGGFMTTSLMLRYPGQFKAGIAGGPVIDWRMYEVMYTERYMDTPQANPEGYRKAALAQYVPQLKGKLMIIQGLEDDVVVPEHSTSLVNAFIAKGIVIDYFPYPNHKHNVLGKERAHLYKKVEDYIKTQLQPTEPRP